MKQLLKRYSTFRRDEDGTATVEFVIIFLGFILFLGAAVEISVKTLRQTALESRLDQTMRQVRINTGIHYSHNDLRDMMCENAPLFENCQENLRLEMITNDPRSYSSLNSEVDCVNREAPMTSSENAPRNFHLGQSNELVIVRACLLNDPVVSHPAILSARTSGALPDGYYALVAVSAFTQEPR